jgi:8-oxo-dGTP pyrophosphatase MutT (NUDIX family)
MNSIKDKKIEVALAILYQDGKFLMQLRDEIPNILYPGHWGLFGGHLEDNETPEDGVIREVWEEINYTLDSPLKFRAYETPHVIRHVYHAPLTVALDQLNLWEGWDLALLEPAEIKTGFCYSVKAQAKKPVGEPHAEIITDFLTTRG